MTEWNGIKVGSIYKRTGRGARSAPLALVVEMKELGYMDWIRNDVNCGVELKTLEGEVLETSFIYNDGSGGICYADGFAGAPSWRAASTPSPWPYKEVV